MKRSRSKTKRTKKNLKSLRRRTKMVRSLRKKSKSQTKKCKSYLQSKIAINMKEFKRGKFVSPQQALAVSYREVAKKKPLCKKKLKIRDY